MVGARTEMLFTGHIDKHQDDKKNEHGRYNSETKDTNFWNNNAKSIKKKQLAEDYTQKRLKCFDLFERIQIYA